MRTALRKDAILKSICQHLTRIDRGFATLIALARTSKSLKETPLDVLWGTGAVSFADALKTLPPDSWSATKDFLVRCRFFYALRTNTDMNRSS
jgi:hypothetical protein